MTTIAIKHINFRRGTNIETTVTIERGEKEEELGLKAEREFRQSKLYEQLIWDKQYQTGELLAQEYAGFVILAYRTLSPKAKKAYLTERGID